MSTITYNCPCCGAPLIYDGMTEKLVCRSCDNSFDSATMEQVQEINHSVSQGYQINWNVQEGSRDDYEAARSYICQSCGAELVTEETTTSTVCAYCGSPVVLTDHLDDSISPAFVLPFRVTEEEARKKFSEYFHKKHLIPNIFQNTQNRISEIRRLYVPYWLFSCDADASMTFNATRVRVNTFGDVREIRTSHFLVRRAAQMTFSNIPVDGATKLDNRITESLEPFDFNEAIPFTTATLTGSMADRADVDAEECKQRADERLRTSVKDALRSSVIGYNTVTERGCSIHVDNGKATPVLLPVWLIRTDKNVHGETVSYTFAINGQTGSLTCDIPWSKGRAAKWFFGLTAAISAGGCALLLALAALGHLGGAGL